MSNSGGDYTRDYSGDNDHYTNSRRGNRPSATEMSRGLEDYFRAQARAGMDDADGAESNSKSEKRRIADLVNPLKTVITGSLQYNQKKRSIPGTMKFKDGARWYESCDFAGDEENPPADVLSIVFMIDGTDSRQYDRNIIFKKIVMFCGEAKAQGYVGRISVSLCLVGDATCDEIPIQAGHFESDERLDEILAKFVVEGGGGGTGQESYELAALLYAMKSKLDCYDKRGQKGIFIMLVDEGFYPKVSKEQAEKYLGIHLAKDMDSAEVWQMLQEKYHVFPVYLETEWEEHKAGIDKEIEKRLRAAGGMFENVDIRCSLMWNSFDDLDLHCICPDGSHIYYPRNARRYCGGELDVDANGLDEKSKKPVENIRWPKGEAMKGHYRFFVNLYNYYNESSPKQIHFKAECDVNGKIETFDGDISGVGRDIPLFEFDYDPDKRPTINPAKKYDGYKKETVLNQFASVVPRSQILTLRDPARIIDLALAILAELGGVSQDEYDEHMAARGQEDYKRQEVRAAMEPLVNSRKVVEQEGDLANL